MATAEAALRRPLNSCCEREQGLADSTGAAEQAREAERQALAAREDLVRVVGNLAREAAESDAQLQRLTERRHPLGAAIGRDRRRDSCPGS